MLASITALTISALTLYALATYKPKDERVVVINSLLKENLKQVKGENTVYPYIRSHTDDTYLIELPTGFEFKQLENLKGKLENGLKEYVSITNDNFTYIIKIEEQVETPTNIPFKLIDTKNGELKVAVGMSKNDLVYLNFQKAPHTLIGGSTGWGKSVFTKGLILQLLHNYPSCELELFDFKVGVELFDFKELKQTKTFVTKSWLAQPEIERIYDEINERFEQITSSRCRDIFEFNSKSNNKMQYKFVIIEEFTVLLDIQDELSDTLTKSLALSRAVGIYFIFTSQRFSADIIDGKIKTNIDNRICFRVVDGINSKIILDSAGAEKLRTKGRAILSQGGEQQEFQSFNVSQSDIDMVIKPHLDINKGAKEETLWA